MFEKELELAIRAAQAGGSILMAEKQTTVNSAEGKDLKLSTDRDSEAAILSVLREGSPYSILTEERGLQESEERSGFRWIVDPLDGSVNFFRGIKELTCISIALWKEEEPVLGVVFRYASDELFYGVKGKGAFCNGMPIKPSETTKVTQAIVATGFPTYLDYGAEKLMPLLRTAQRFKKVRMLGTAAIMGTFVAAGRVDAYFEDHIALWDIAAAAAIVAAAGGNVRIRPLSGSLCTCMLFANEKLMEDYDAESV